ncbi:hypothetical protein RirG_027370 [Rhizophagus irregularis DAOM 197198w]|uniref:Uncharacterized protein n=1 Tax=Rhizophagus irregularis (strain DAOM 197198w) TaxID=1432141 RepID=A0A015LWG7_RHIIW|nr:hypothetical protein RirG_027370 [Rhizophagus irregularis DAOM 197198w]
MLFPLLDRGVTRGAQALPVRWVPEHRHVAPMRGDVVDDRGSSHQALALAVDAQRVGSQVMLAGLLPFVAVAALGGALLVGAPGVGLHHRHAAGLVADAGLERGQT